jgi:hypothetical protein
VPPGLTEGLLESCPLGEFVETCGRRK